MAKTGTDVRSRRNTKPATKRPKKTVDTVVLEIPVRPVENQGYLPRHVDAQLDREQGLALRLVLEALMHRGTQLKSGRYVQRMPDVIRWLGEQIANELTDRAQQARRTATGAA